MSAVRFRPPAPPAGLRSRPLYRRLPPPGHPGAERRPDSRTTPNGRTCRNWPMVLGSSSHWMEHGYRVAGVSSRWASSLSGSRSAFSSPAKPPAPSPVIVGLEAERPPPGRRSEDVRTPAEHRPNTGPNALPALRGCGADRSRERRRKGAWRGAWSCRWTGPDRAGVPARGPGAHRRRPGAPRRPSCRSSPPGGPGSRSASPARRPRGRGARRQEGRTGETTGRDCRETTGKGRRRPPCP